MVGRLALLGLAICSLCLHAQQHTRLARLEASLDTLGRGSLLGPS